MTLIIQFPPPPPSLAHARPSARHAALGLQLAHRLMKGEQRVRRRREPELPSRLEAAPLGEEVKRDAACRAALGLNRAVRARLLYL